MKSAIALFGILALTVSAASCRNSRRAVRVGADAATLKVTLSKMDATDAKRADLIYELSGCAAPLTGATEADGTVSFSAVGLKAGLTGCQLKIKTLNVSGITFAKDSEAGVLYWSKDLPLTQDATGKLTAIATLQKLYAVTGSSAALFTLEVPVKFATPETGKVITAAIGCSPEITAAGLFERATDNEGKFIFKTEIAAEATYSCTSMEVRIDGSPEARHTAALTAKFTGKPGDTITTGVVELVKVTPKDGGSGVDVTTTGENCNEEGKEYNAETRKCEAVPTPVATRKA